MFRVSGVLRSPTSCVIFRNKLLLVVMHSEDYFSNTSLIENLHRKADKKLQKSGKCTEIF